MHKGCEKVPIAFGGMVRCDRVSLGTPRPISRQNLFTPVRTAQPCNGIRREGKRFATHRKGAYTYATRSATACPTTDGETF